MTSACADYNDTVELGSLLRYVNPTVNTLPYENGVQLLRQAYQDFARRTEILGARQDIVLQKDVSDYEITPPDGYEFYKARGLEWGAEYFSMPNCDYWYTRWGARFAVIGTRYLLFRDTPSVDTTVEPFHFVFTVVPDECVTRIPREISVSFGEALGKRVLSEVLTYPNKSWTNPTLAMKKEREYNIAVQSARNLVLNNRGAASNTARTRRWC